VIKEERLSGVLIVVAVPSAIFIWKKVLECKERPKIRLERGGVSYTNARKKGFWNAIMACVLLRKNFQNGVLAPSITKYPCFYPT
jgi:hypothetical protein